MLHLCSLLDNADLGVHLLCSLNPLSLVYASWVCKRLRKLVRRVVDDDDWRRTWTSLTSRFENVKGDIKAPWARCKAWPKQIFEHCDSAPGGIHWVTDIADEFDYRKVVWTIVTGYDGVVPKKLFDCIGSIGSIPFSIKCVQRRKTMQKSVDRVVKDLRVGLLSDSIYTIVISLLYADRATLLQSGIFFEMLHAFTQITIPGVRRPPTVLVFAPLSVSCLPRRAKALLLKSSLHHYVLSYSDGDNRLKAEGKLTRENTEGCVIVDTRLLGF